LAVGLGLDEVAGLGPQEVLQLDQILPHIIQLHLLILSTRVLLVYASCPLPECSDLSGLDAQVHTGLGGLEDPVQGVVRQGRRT